MQTRTGAEKRKKLDIMRNQSNGEEVDSEPDPPTKFFFNHNCYKTSQKLSSRYSHENVPNELKKVLTEEELDWFIYHPQFKHIWHTNREATHKFNPMWLLLLRTVFIDKEKVCWFVVNGVPIRYSIREHGLLCGLNCSSYPPNHLDLGSNDFFIRNFGDVEKNKVMIKDVKEKLSSNSFAVKEDRLKMAVLLFLSIIVIPKKVAGTIDEYLFRIVDDLSACERFPWGRYTFIDTINNISHLIQWLKDDVGKDWVFPGFIYPLEIMACESIQKLKRQYREDVADADPNCPRMCKSKWKRNKKTLKAVNETLGDTKEIHSILDPRLEEKCLVDKIFEAEKEQLYSSNPVARSWEKRLIENKKIFWEELYQQDIYFRGPNAPVLQNQEWQMRPRPLKLRDDQDQLMRAMETSMRKLETKIITRLSNLETEVRTVRTKVRNLETEFRTSREKIASEFNGFCENGHEHEHAGDSYGGGGDENTKECEDEVQADTLVTDRITSDAAEGPLGDSFQECVSTKESMMKQIEEKHHENAASVFCCLYKKAPPPQSLFLSKKNGFFGVVALLGSVACMSLSRVLSDYLGKDKMLSLVCKSSQSGRIRDEYCNLQSEAASLGRSITNTLKVICLDAVRPWRYGLVNNNPQKRLAINNPYLPNGDPIPGFKGYAVNMIDLASEDLLIQSTSGHGLRETLFYSILGELQVYETSEHLEAARPYINGKDAVCLDGVISTTYGFIFPGSCAPEVHFPITKKAVVKLEITEDRKRKTEKMVTEDTCPSHKLVKMLKKATEE